MTAPGSGTALKGVFCPTLTPLEDDGAPSVALLERHCRWLLERGCHGIVLFGTTGEANSFTVDERRGLLEALLAARFPAERLIVGTGCCAVGDTVALTRHALQAGCPRVLALPPFYYKGVAEAGVVDAYARTIEGVADDRLALLLYRIPQLSGVDITPTVVDALVSRYGRTIAGIKDSSGDWPSTEMLCRRFGSTLAVFVGSERHLLAALDAGAAGCITATANADPAPIRELYDGPSEQRQAVATAARERFARGPTIALLKAAVAERTNDERWQRVRPPLVAAATLD